MLKSVYDRVKGIPKNIHDRGLRAVLSHSWPRAAFAVATAIGTAYTLNKLPATPFDILPEAIWFQDTILNTAFTIGSSLLMGAVSWLAMNRAAAEKAFPLWPARTVAFGTGVGAGLAAKMLLPALLPSLLSFLTIPIIAFRLGASAGHFTLNALRRRDLFPALNRDFIRTNRTPDDDAAYYADREERIEKDQDWRKGRMSRVLWGGASIALALFAFYASNDPLFAEKVLNGNGIAQWGEYFYTKADWIGLCTAAGLFAAIMLEEVPKKLHGVMLAAGTFFASALYGGFEPSSLLSIAEQPWTIAKDFAGSVFNIGDTISETIVHWATTAFAVSLSLRAPKTVTNLLTNALPKFVKSVGRYMWYNPSSVDRDIANTLFSRRSLVTLKDVVGHGARMPVVWGLGIIGGMAGGILGGLEISQTVGLSQLGGDELLTTLWKDGFGTAFGQWSQNVLYGEGSGVARLAIGTITGIFSGLATKRIAEGVSYAIGKSVDRLIVPKKDASSPAPSLPQIA